MNPRGGSALKRGPVNFGKAPLRPAGGDMGPLIGTDAVEDIAHAEPPLLVIAINLSSTVRAPPLSMAVRARSTAS